MLLRNTSARLVTINIVEGESIKILPGDNPAVEVSDEVIKSTPFVKHLLKAGVLREELPRYVAPVEDDDKGDELESMNKTELTTYAETFGIKVTSKMNIADIIVAVRELLDAE
jgi:hypothetical protein